MNALSNVEAVVHENILASLVILRYMEEMNVSISQADCHSHLLGTRVFLAAQESVCHFKDLRLAAFWVALRQEIYMAFIHGRPVHSYFMIDKVESSQADINGCGYANKVIIHCADCLRYCYGTEEKTVSKWQALVDYLDEWWRDRPWMFHPTWASEADEGSDAKFLHEEILLNSAVVTGIQHYHLARTLLAAHDPTIPRLGPGQHSSSRSANENVKRAVRCICAIAEVNHSRPFYSTRFALVARGLRLTTSPTQSNLHTPAAFV